ncbi:MAG: alpha/beta hydrolase [Ginsengibacter sp.]|jgi:acetyl esterase/lipase
MKNFLSIILFALIFVSCSKDNIEPTINPAKEIKNLAYGNDPMQKMDVYFPVNYSSQTPVVFLIHGGGFIAGTKEDFNMQAQLFLDEGFVTVNLSHRLIDSTGLLSLPPQHLESIIKVKDEVDDVNSAVKKYQSMASTWGTGTSKMYMAGHSAGATLSMLYVQGDYNIDGHIKASGNWAGLTDLSIPNDTLLPHLDPRFVELLFRTTGQMPNSAHNLFFMAISPYWVAYKDGERPNISIFPERNIVFNYLGEVEWGLLNTHNFHQLLRDRGIKEKLSVYTDEDHGFGTYPGSWKKLIAETADFFRSI